MQGVAWSRGSDVVYGFDAAAFDHLVAGAGIVQDARGLNVYLVSQHVPVGQGSRSAFHYIDLVGEMSSPNWGGGWWNYGGTPPQAVLPCTSRLDRARWCHLFAFSGVLDRGLPVPGQAAAAYWLASSRAPRPINLAGIVQGLAQAHQAGLPGLGHLPAMICTPNLLILIRFTRNLVPIRIGFQRNLFLLIRENHPGFL